MTLRVVELDPTGWTDELDFCRALKAALGSCEGHGDSPDAFNDSMVWGGMNRLEPPCVIRIMRSAVMPQEVRDYVALVAAVVRNVGRK
jgi:hypothetical protein